MASDADTRMVPADEDQRISGDAAVSTQGKSAQSTPGEGAAGPCFGDPSRRRSDDRKRWCWADPR